MDKGLWRGTFRVGQRLRLDRGWGTVTDLLGIEGSFDEAQRLQFRSGLGQPVATALWVGDDGYWTWIRHEDVLEVRDE